VELRKNRSRGAKPGSSAKPNRGTSRNGGDKRKREPIIGFRASADERAQIQAAADRAGLTVGSYVRSCALTRPTTRAVRRPPVATAQLAQLLGLLGASGGEIQRMAMTLDAKTAVDADIQAALAAFREAASAIMQTLGKRTHDY
jgi:uncharacterized protein (DUF1778 family)